MEFTAFIKIATLVLGMLAFVYVMAWVFQGTTEEDENGRKPLIPRLGNKKHQPGNPR